MDGEEVVLAGWVHEVRDIGKIVFILLRDHTGIVQVTAKRGIVSEETIIAMHLPKESTIQIRGRLSLSGVAKKGFEIIPTTISNLNPLSGEIPFEVTGKVPADIDVRLNHRQIDLRRRETTAIFNIQSTLLRAFRDTVLKEGFQEIRTPSIVKEATEGGSDLFKVAYFEQDAYLAQSPQLYKQLAVIGGMDRVFMVTPVFRAEKSNTTFHLNEITQMDIEMGFADHSDAIRMLKLAVTGMVREVANSNAEELELLGVRPETDEVVEVSYVDAIKKLSENGARIDFGQDFTREHEKELSRLYGNMLIVKGYPTTLRAFYSMPSQKDPEISNSYDFIFRGTEISSGAERIHKPEMLVAALESRGEDPSAFSSYIDAFREGAPPHAGWSIGLERFTMKITGMENIRECSLFPRDRTRLLP